MRVRLLHVPCALMALSTTLPTEADMRIAWRGTPRCLIITQPGATPAEQYAARELADALQRVTGAQFTIRQVAEAPSEPIILVGPGPLAQRLFPEVSLATFGPEQYTVQTRNGRLLLAGGRPRGTLYAVMSFLQEQCGVRWWTPWAAHYPRRATLAVKDLRITGQPAFEARDPFWFHAFDTTWAVRNGSNSASARLQEQHGGKIVYKGFVHTFYSLVPPEQHFKTHPEWYSEKDGRRYVEGGQLCTTNPQLRDFIVERVKEWLRETPEASIVSVSQNDWYGACLCANCRALDQQEGTHAASVLALANYVAGRIAPEFPQVAIDTLAYQYTRKAPKTLRPRSSVIVRLCSIECNFAVPLAHPANQAFATDLRDWSRLSHRLYIWDYTTNFAHYVLPHPNWFSLGPNIRFFHQHGVRGVFEQGAYQSNGAEMAELRAWVLARLLWNPYQDDRKLIKEFLNGYYGPAAARYIWQYMTLMHRAARNFNLTCYTNPLVAPFLRFPVLAKAERLWQQALEATRNDPERFWRVQQGHLPVRYAFLVRWPALRRECRRLNAPWPLPASRKAVAQEWLAVATGPGPAGWSPMTHVNEAGLTPQQFVQRFAEDPTEPEEDAKPAVASAATRRRKHPAPPPDIPLEARRGAVDVQDLRARLHGEGDLVEILPDPAASDGMAARMPGNHREWAFQVHMADLPPSVRTGRWQIYAVVRVELNPGAQPGDTVFAAGVYDTENRVSGGEIRVTAGEVASMYRAYHIATLLAGPQYYIWVAPPASDAVKALWIDRIYLVPARERAQ
ncbi:MAG: DUF4838 domain-containing protein [Chloroherpetonaceae bacterium]|nr:DUF4838 domain-containing protein [Chthonomonadaceae bacterium]MDW8207197.1 DUF4838 domain-containing protein [Chloroherpetonaceae bacterium]